NTVEASDQRAFCKGGVARHTGRRANPDRHNRDFGFGIFGTRHRFPESARHRAGWRSHRMEQGSPCAAFCGCGAMAVHPLLAARFARRIRRSARNGTRSSLLCIGPARRTQYHLWFRIEPNESRYLRRLPHLSAKQTALDFRGPSRTVANPHWKYHTEKGTLRAGRPERLPQFRRRSGVPNRPGEALGPIRGRTPTCENLPESLRLLFDSAFGNHYCRMVGFPQEVGFKVRFILAMIVMAMLQSLSVNAEDPLPTTIVTVLPDVKIKAELALDDATRAKGLMFRKSLAENAGMLFVFPVLDFQS